MKHLSHMSEEKDYPVIPGRPWQMETYLKNYYPELEEGWRLTETCLRELRDEGCERGIAFHAYAIPAKYELGSKMAHIMVNNTEADPLPYDFSTNSRRTKQMLERLDVPNIELRSVLLQTQCPEHYYWKHDAHMNAAGCLLVAELLKPVVWKEYCRWKERASDRVQQTEAKR